jgi:hypothetical protein
VAVLQVVLDQQAVLVQLIQVVLVQRKIRQVAQDLLTVLQAHR